MPCAASPSCAPADPTAAVVHKFASCKADVHWACARKAPRPAPDSPNASVLAFCSDACCRLSPAPDPAPPQTPVFALAPPPCAAAAAAAATALGLAEPGARPPSAAAISAARYRHRSVFKPEHGVRYGMAVHDRDDESVVRSVACRFCVAFGRGCAPGSAAMKRRVSKTHKVFKHPFRTDLFQRHLMEHHQERWRAYKDWRDGEKEAFFSTQTAGGGGVPSGAVGGQNGVVLAQNGAVAVPNGAGGDSGQAQQVVGTANGFASDVPSGMSDAVPLPAASPVLAGVIPTPSLPPARQSLSILPAPPPVAAAEPLYLSCGEFAAALAASVTQDTHERFSAEQQLWLPPLLAVNCEEFHLPTYTMRPCRPTAPRSTSRSRNVTRLITVACASTCWRRPRMRKRRVPRLPVKRPPAAGYFCDRPCEVRRRCWCCRGGRGKWGLGGARGGEEAYLGVDGFEGGGRGCFRGRREEAQEC